MALSFFWSWLRRRRMAGLEPLHFIVYTRRGCHLCEDACQCLTRAQRRYRFTLTAVDIDGDAELAGRYGDQVPVVTVNGKLRFRGYVNEVLLERLLKAETGQG
jgi:glutaredoxin